MAAKAAVVVHLKAGLPLVPWHPLLSPFAVVTAQAGTVTGSTAR